ncbi:MarR family winged helix-turn-helix transcriptional regulator [Metaclostridioides mangenotii]|uniref:MarR family winged helix-turn-helix transcriptional regulator n=1 Tax=Metaclostridioides mangenotii TaxID=1540 RepID=UPI000465061C|nr:MarR family transcriptional regulator [Clostridioides mangenotii]
MININTERVLASLFKFLRRREKTKEETKKVIQEISKRIDLENNLTLSEIQSVYHIGANNGINQSELSHLMLMTRGATSKICKKLQSKDLIALNCKRDNLKEFELTLTCRGKNLFELAAKRHEDEVRHKTQLFDKYTEEELEFIYKLFEDLAERY